MSIRSDEPHFAQCELGSNGTGYSIRTRGRTRLYDRAGYDDLADGRFVLGYGRSRRLGVFTCTSRGERDDLS